MTRLPGSGRPGSVTEPHRLPMGVAREPTTKTAAQTSAEAGQRAEPVSLLATTQQREAEQSAVPEQVIIARGVRTREQVKLEGAAIRPARMRRNATPRTAIGSVLPDSCRPARHAQPFGGEDVARHEAVEEEVQLAVDAGLVQEHHREQPGGKHRESQARAGPRRRPCRRKIQAKPTSGARRRPTRPKRIPRPTRSLPGPEDPADRPKAGLDRGYGGHVVESREGVEAQSARVPLY